MTASTLCFFGYSGQSTPLALVRLEDFFAESQRLRSHFNELVVSDKLNRLFEIQLPKWHQTNGFVCC